MKVINWNEHKNNLKKTQFSQKGPRSILDILIGVNQADLHYYLRDIREQPGEPIAKLTPLGWTSIDYTSVYSANYSCETALISVGDDILWAMEDKKVTVFAAIDLSEAFDTVEHEK
ncbi:hypothetical protein LSH36_339g03026 [Paralvinella palmiformis]|uniref:Reverse transcriptase domain-containing protein n=1 Tax=Paralvinella palmiformis TaxID=53620 RepID=A0AAD9JFC7_9ANNE|nr:hypothetical protein LSH36_339g03026 [Paralvinella palmiformis]